MKPYTDEVSKSKYLEKATYNDSKKMLSSKE